MDALRLRRALVASRATLTSLSFDGDVAATVADANDDLHEADHIAHDSPWLAALAAVPVLGGQIDAVRDVTAEAARIGEVTGAAATAIDAAAADTDDGPGRLAFVSVAQAHLADVEAVLADVEPDDRFLLPPLRGALGDFDEEVAGRLTDVREVLGRLPAIHRLLTGPSRYLVLGANNAEMSGSVGMPLTAGVLEIAGGELDLSEFVQTSELLAIGGPPLDDDIERLYANQGFSYDFRGTTASPDFPFVAPVMAAMSARVATGPVDGVFLVDTIAVGALIDATAPVTVAGLTYSGDQALYQLLVGNYLQYRDFDARDERVEVQGEFANAVFDNLTSGDTSITSLAGALGDLARGRHLLAWSADPELQGLWEELGADGDVGPRSLAVSVENMDGNKLDPAIQPQVELDTTPLPNGETQAELTVEFTNPDIPGASAYMLGNGPEIHFAQLVLHLPEGSSAVDVLEAPERIFQVEAEENDSVVVTALYGTYVDETSRYHVRFKFPRGLEAIEIVPSARYLGSRYDVNGVEFLDRLPTTVPLEPPEGDHRTTGELVAGGVAAVAALAVGIAAAATRRRLRAA